RDAFPKSSTRRRPAPLKERSHASRDVSRHNVVTVIFVLKSRLHHEGHEDHEGKTRRESETPGTPLFPNRMTSPKML
ncbi:MAG: hypothetical protein ACK58T_09955, partial [Phycisphaerae bacterium]